jgi:hypothetical protein
MRGVIKRTPSETLQIFKRAGIPASIDLVLELLKLLQMPAKGASVCMFDLIKNSTYLVLGTTPMESIQETG